MSIVRLRSIRNTSGSRSHTSNSPRSPTSRSVTHGFCSAVQAHRALGPCPTAGGWSRVVLKVADLPRFITELKKAGVRFRNEMETGPGGRQIQIEDPDGNPIELFEPAR